MTKVAAVSFLRCVTGVDLLLFRVLCCTIVIRLGACEHQICQPQWLFAAKYQSVRVTAESTRYDHVCEPLVEACTSLLHIVSSVQV